jgi:hypothetical protein
LKSVPAFPTEKSCIDELSPFIEVIHPLERVIHDGIPPLIERTCPFVPFVSPMVFPIRVSPLLNVRKSENSPVRLLYEIPPVAESEVRLILLLKVFQSVNERAPVVDVLASARESSCPERERPLALPRVRAA